MLRASTRVSDLIFSPGGLPHIEVSGQLVPVKITGLPPLGNDDTRRIAEELIAGNQQALTALREQGSCDVSYSLPGQCRFRVNIFMQRGSHAIVMRVIPQTIPTFAELKLPQQLAEIANLKNGIVLITGPSGSGKSSTMAAVLAKLILVGEMRDKETIEIALEAAETGHLVLSTLHTIDASKPSSAS